MNKAQFHESQMSFLMYWKSVTLKNNKKTQMFIIFAIIVKFRKQTIKECTDNMFTLCSKSDRKESNSDHPRDSDLL